MQQTSRIELNRRQYRDTDLRYLIQPECDVLDMYVDDIRFAGTRVLEIGPGNGRNTAYLLQAGFSVEAIDNDQSVLEILSKNLEASGIDSSRYYPILQDIANFAFPTNAYALVNISHVLHFFSFEASMAIIDRLVDALVPDGLLLIRVHAREPWPLETTGDFKHFFKLTEFDWLRTGRTKIISQVTSCTFPSRKEALARAKVDGSENDPNAVAHFFKNGICDIELVIRRNP